MVQRKKLKRMKHIKKYEDHRKREEETIDRFKKQTTPMFKDEAVDYIINHCSEWLDHPIKIMRSLSDHNNLIFPDIFHVNPVKRYSRDNPNHYTTIMDNDYSWRKFPKRSKSLICSISYSFINRLKYYVIPEDDSVWSVAPNRDIYDCFDVIKIPLDMFFNKINKIYYYYFRNDIDDLNIKNIKKSILKIQDKITPEKLREINDKFLYLSNDQYKIFEEIFIHSNNAYTEIIKKMNPNKNGFQILDLKGMYIGNWDKNEIWTESSVLMIHESFMRSVIEKIEKETGKKINVK